MRILGKQPGMKCGAGRNEWSNQGNASPEIRCASYRATQRSPEILRPRISGRTPPRQRTTKRSCRLRGLLESWRTENQLTVGNLWRHPKRSSGTPVSHKNAGTRAAWELSIVTVLWGSCDRVEACAYTKVLIAACYRRKNIRTGQEITPDCRILEAAEVESRNNR